MPLEINQLFSETELTEMRELGISADYLQSLLANFAPVEVREYVRISIRGGGFDEAAGPATDYNFGNCY